MDFTSPSRLSPPISVMVSNESKMAYLQDTNSYTIARRLQDRINANGTNYGGLNDLLYCPRWRDADLTYLYTFELQGLLQGQQNSTSDQTIINALQVEIDTLTALQPVVKDARDCTWISDVFSPYDDLVCNSYLYVTATVSCLTLA